MIYVKHPKHTGKSFLLRPLKMSKEKALLPSFGTGGCHRSL